MEEAHPHLDYSHRSPHSSVKIVLRLAHVRSSDQRSVALDVLLGPL